MAENYIPFDPYTDSQTGADAVIDLGVPQSGKRWAINSIEFSYGAAPTGGLLTITSGGTEVRRTNITAAGVGPIVEDTRFGVDEQVIVTLGSGGGGIVGSLNLSARQIH